MAPIVGPRFKCTVTKNFDFCAQCESTKEHPHAFLKIAKPDQAPRAMFTVIDETVPGEADIDINVNDLQNLGQAIGFSSTQSLFPMFRHHRGGPHGRRHHGPRGENTAEGGPMPRHCGPRGMGRGLKNQVGFFMRQMFGDQAMHTGEETGGQRCHKKAMTAKGLVARKNPKRAIPLNHPKIDHVHVACPGEELVVDVTFRNGGMHSYRAGFHV